MVLYCVGVKLHIGYSEPERTVGLRRFSYLAMMRMMRDASIVPLDLVLQYLTLLPMATM
jgi:hypothetical protein